jgi:hypothetical protein
MLAVTWRPTRDRPGAQTTPFRAGGHSVHEFRHAYAPRAPPLGHCKLARRRFCLSRPALYALARRVEVRLTNPAVTVQLTAPAPLSTATVTENRLIPTTLTASLPGKAALRPTGEILQEAFGRKRSPSWLNELLRQAGVKAGNILRRVDTSALQMFW